MSEPHQDEYDDNLVSMLELIWGEGFMAPGGELRPGWYRGRRPE